MLRVIIAGSRDFNDYHLLKTACSSIFYKLASKCVINKSNIEVVSGGARGADSLGERFATENGIQIKRFPANWNAYGKRAGYIRNNQMAEYASDGDNYGVLIAFWDGKSKGTKNMFDIAKRKGIETYVIDYENRCVLK